MLARESEELACSPPKFMKQTKRKSIGEYIADRIIRNQMRVKFSTAHADFLEEQYNMSPQHPKTDAQIEAQKHAEHLALLNRIAELEQRVAALKGKN